MAISFEAIGQKMVTFAAGTGLAEGKVCKISANGTVGPCSEEGFCGVVSQIRGGAAGVILRGTWSFRMRARRRLRSATRF